MKITEVEAIYLRLPELDATKADGTQDTLVVRVHTDEELDELRVCATRQQ
jgi:L-rhamnonate dehydratase